ncbi:hypothetical protein BLS_004433 [Venturia inaequalis]|uniref:UBA domain-containing protein n=1 Tax=Venturia inaequalis TaxID=5025 RepID=A0A8H3UXZ8_VENIN|nr:hypothetical protein BLS_004433 [Venturia inaequalis]KAE9977698.1 hypothetical protein EG327_007655 [Venturia inaequalis]RDI85868.1 hypothetical protein Vi05172_g4076 [Venturia inaequalis]
MSSSPSTESPRLVLYHQTIHHNGKFVSIKPLTQTGVTHVYIAAIHLNDPPENITLNDHHPDDPRYEELWQEVEYVQGIEKPITVMGMLGGAAKGSYEKLERNFEPYYAVLSTLIRKRSLQGLDLDVEEPTKLSTIQKLITRLKADFGSTFIITLAPVMPALLPRSPRLTSLTYRLLHPELPASESSIVRALCQARFLKSHKHLSGFNHFELEASDAGKLVEWYNVQFYCGWGDASNTRFYEALVTAGWNPRKLVLGVVTNPGNGAGHVELEKLQDVVKTLATKYGNQFGGVMGWEYFNAVREKDASRAESMQRPIELPWMWAFDLAHVMGKLDVTNYEEAEREAYTQGLPSRAGSSTPNPTSQSHPHPPDPAPASTNATIQAQNPFAQLIASLPSPPPPPPQEQQPRPPQTPQNEASTQQLVDMGAERAEAIAALEAMEGNVDAAAALLFGD